MMISKSINSRKFSSAGLALLTAATLIGGGAGCSNWNLRGDGFRDQTGSNAIRQARGGTHPPEFMGFSNKAREINDNFAD
ncbi:MAG: hypothetical protein JXB10_18725 [Pirellulales bacterium]|nr:hypothetical protein [Pirellulales bacterium]